MAGKGEKRPPIYVRNSSGRRGASSTTAAVAFADPPAFPSGIGEIKNFKSTWRGKRKLGADLSPQVEFPPSHFVASPGVGDALVPALEDGPHGGGAARGVVVGLVYSEKHYSVNL